MKNGFCFFVIFSLVLEKKKDKSDDVISGYSVETNHKINNISGNIDALLMKLGTSNVP